MQSKPDGQLLREYAEGRAEAAFTELVHRHTNLVYSAALRHVNLPEVAAEISQNVFVGLARGAELLSRRVDPHASLAGWLCRSARNQALNHQRDNFRRQQRERQAMELTPSDSDPAPDWECLRPILDAAMADLPEADYEAIVMRFFNQQDLRTVGQALGVSDDAAQKRVTRALDQLREHLTNRGVTTTSAALAGAISANAVQTAPAGLAVIISSSIPLAATTLAAATTAKIIAMTTLQKSIVTLALASAVGAGVYEAHQASQLRNENQRLSSQAAALTGERDAALASLTEKSNALEQTAKDKSELLRLRGEIGKLNRDSKELASLRSENQKLRATLAAPQQAKTDSDAEEDSEKQIAIAKMNDAKQLMLGLLMYANDHGEHLPTELNHTSNYWANSNIQLTGTNQFELVVQGSITNLTNPAELVAVREKAPTLIKGKWVKVYGFADGHAEVRPLPPEGFDAWEKQHMQPQPAQ